MGPAADSGKVLFWFGLAGILATGAIIGMGGDNYWALANVGRLNQNVPSVRGLTLLFVMGVMVGFLDLIAFGVIFAGGVLVIQRIRGRL